MAKLTLFVYLVLVVAVLANASAQETACEKERREAKSSSSIGQRIPVCDSDGNYAPQQCSGSQCYCVMKDGTTIDNFVPISESSEQNCKCARDREEYQKTGLIGLIFTCSTNGNYEEVQCKGSTCYCVDEDGKKIGEKTVHVSKIKELEC